MLPWQILFITKCENGNWKIENGMKRDALVPERWESQLIEGGVHRIALHQE
jgi:hypothetical protein